MRIGKRKIGDGVYIIAEIGVNHDGDAERALALASAAAEAGADAIKLQYFRASDLLSRDASLASYQRDAGETDPISMLQRLELSLDEMRRIIEHAHELGIDAIVTPFSCEHVDALAALPWDAMKAASPDVINKPLLDAIARTGLPMIVSTGAADADEVRRASEWLAACHDRLAFLHCVSSYPTPPVDASIAACRAVAELTSCPTGYSDHTAGVEAGGIATGEAGAALLEKHLTDDCSRAGPDHAASLEPGDMAEYVRRARAGSVDGVDNATLSRMLGDGQKRALDVELDVRRLSRQSVVAARAIEPGQAIQRADLTIRRPGTGIEPWRIDEFVGRRAAASIAAGACVMDEHFVATDASLGGAA
ncbi:MAG: N-acetylneuraminate synthase family protein [Planctomycetota bacterium]